MQFIKLTDLNMKVTATTLIIILALVDMSCKGPPAPQNEAAGILSLLQQNNSMTARINGEMTFNTTGANVTLPMVLEVRSVPIQWMGQVFNGELETSGPGSNITDQVHGGVSADGKWLLSGFYSRLVIRGDRYAFLYRVNLKNVPLADSSNNNTSRRVSFEREGDVRKFLEEAVYVQGIWDGTKLVPNSTYTLKEWTELGGRPPALMLILEKADIQKTQQPETMGQ